MKKIVLAISLVLVCFPSISYSLSEKGYDQLRSFAEVLHQVEENYVENVDEKKLLMGSIRGMLMTLDPHTVYMPPEVYKELKVDSVGRFGGVGVEVTMKKGWLTVVSPIEGSPAFKAGVKPGDRIIRVDGTSTKGVNLGEAVAMMRGRVGSRVTLTLVRGKSKHPIDVHLIRRVIKVHSVTAEDLGDGYGYVRISTFQERTTSELKKQLKKLSKSGELKGLIIDLRNNPGGLLGQSIEVSDLFIDHGVIVSTRSRGKEVARYDAHSTGTLPKYPIAILVNGGSASASEIVSGALKDYGLAVLVGTQTFGKGSVQSVYELEDGSAIKITVAKYYTPAGQSIQGFGITPQLVVDAPEEVDGKPVVDTQKEAALGLLKDEAKYLKVLQGIRKHHR
jgi:carboxyl-terminal processing protease